MKIRRKLLLFITSVLFISLTVAGGILIHLMWTGVIGTDGGGAKIFSTDPVNILLMVGDKSDYNTDTMMLINFAPKENRACMISIQRDTKVLINGSTRKINSAFAIGGPQLTTDTISTLLGVNINYFVHIKISTFGKVIDMLGGVYYKIPVNLDYEDPSQGLIIHLKKGYQLLDGDKAEQFLRFRHPQHSWSYSQKFLQYYDGSDTKRTEHQLDFVKQLIKQKANLGYLGQFKNILNTVFEETDTNIDMNDALRLIMCAPKVNYKKIRTFRVYNVADVYSNRLYDTKAEKTYDGAEIIKKFFSAKGKFVSNTITSGVNGGSSSSTSNPSNTSTKIEEQNTPKP